MFFLSRLPVLEVDRGVPAADFDGRLGLVTCGRSAVQPIGQSKTILAKWQWIDSPKDGATREQSSDCVQVEETVETVSFTLLMVRCTSQALHPVLRTSRASAPSPHRDLHR